MLRNIGKGPGGDGIGGRLAESIRIVPRDIIVVGASAGGVNALKKLLADLPPELPASVCLTMHLFGTSDEMLLEILQKASALPVRRAADGMPLEHGHAYLAPTDCHLLFAPDRVRLGHGPRENMQRPCINAMFRSAAAVFGERVTGVVLTGLLDDGAAGLWAIQQQGGATIVQDPKEAEYPSMPQAALQAFNVDYALGLAEMPALLKRLASGQESGRSKTVAEAYFHTGSMQTCPECGGAMTQERFGRSHEYRCHVGHRYGAKTMVEAKRAVHEKGLLSALAQTEEFRDLLVERMGQVTAEEGEAFQQEIASLQQTMQTLRELIEGSPVAANSPAVGPEAKP